MFDACVLKSSLDVVEHGTLTVAVTFALFHVTSVFPKTPKKDLKAKAEKLLEDIKTKGVKLPVWLQEKVIAFKVQGDAAPEDETR